jgi:hypothetical protein
MCLKCMDKFQKWFPHTKRKSPKTLDFRSTALTFAWPQSFRFLSVRTLKTLVYSATIENEMTHHQRILMSVKPFATALC